MVAIRLRYLIDYIEYHDELLIVTKITDKRSISEIIFREFAADTAARFGRPGAARRT